MRVVLLCLFLVGAWASQERVQGREDGIRRLALFLKLDKNVPTSAFGSDGKLSPAALASATCACTAPTTTCMLPIGTNPGDDASMLAADPSFKPKSFSLLEVDASVRAGFLHTISLVCSSVTGAIETSEMVHTYFSKETTEVTSEMKSWVVTIKQRLEAINRQFAFWMIDTDIMNYCDANPRDISCVQALNSVQFLNNAVARSMTYLAGIQKIIEQEEREAAKTVGDKWNDFVDGLIMSVSCSCGGPRKPIESTMLPANDFDKECGKPVAVELASAFLTCVENMSAAKSTAMKATNTLPSRLAVPNGRPLPTLRVSSLMAPAAGPKQ